MSTQAPPLLEVRELSVAFDTELGRSQAVDGLSLRLAPGETLGIVGESGCGKSVTALSIMGLVPSPPARLAGAIRFEGRDLRTASRQELADLRGNRLAMIFQEPMTSLNPAFTVGSQLAEVLVRHRGMAGPAARAAAADMLARVRIPSPKARLDDFPHRLSGGMRQRVMIAMALLCQPALLIADEPTTALDVTIQAQVLELMGTLKQETGAAIILITHDLGVVAEMAGRVIVMYAGQMVEEAPVARLFEAPEHPYTVGLLGALPSLGARKERLIAIEGAVPPGHAMPAGCRFAARCPFADAQCRATAPPVRVVAPGHSSRCWKAPLAALAA